ncbi:MAG: SAM-dependent methyltransferase [Alphaproteobacteria bacterium]
MSPLEALIRARIDTEGPLPVDVYMEMALAHPEHGYYRKRDPLGAAGDFVTAPEIGQVFGELIGLWAGVVWQQMGSPGRLVLAECGPGRGTLMADALRAAEKVTGFLDAAEVHLVETSPTLRDCQRETLAGRALAWHDDASDLPDAPLILIANEFLDALPVRQLVRTETGWRERCVGIDVDGLAFVAGPAAPDAADLLPPDLVRTPPGTVFEFSPDTLSFAGSVAARLAADGGAALFVDYGHAQSAAGDTLQAVRKHAYADPLCDPGDADLTAHVDFGALGRRMTAGGARTHGPVSQRQFLISLGILQRTDQLTRNATPDAAQTVFAATKRLIDPDEMGNLFKVLAATGPGAAPPPAFQ